MECSVYQLLNYPFSKAFPRLLESIVAKGLKIMVLCQDEASTQECDDLLWSFEQLSFLPHQLKGDKCLLPQSIYITDQLADNHNQANVLAFYNPASSIPQGFTRVVYMFSNGEEHLSQEMIARLQQSSFPYSYFVQQADGSWAKKN